MSGRTLTPMPADFPEWAGKEGQEALKKRYRCGQRCIGRWRQECGIYLDARKRWRPELRPVPQDFLSVAHLPVAELIKLYTASSRVVLRWRKLTGTARPIVVKVAPAPKPKPMAPGKRPAGNAGLGAVDRFTRDVSPAGIAADYLRRDVAVIRCDATGAFSATGLFYRHNGTVCDEAEIVRRAELRRWLDAEKLRRMAA